MDEKDWVQPIRRLLTLKQWTQQDLADKAKIRANTISETMNGRSPRMETFEAIAKAFNVPLWMLFVTERQAEVLTKQAAAEAAVNHEAEVAARVERSLMARFAALVHEETAAHMGPKAIEPPAVEIPTAQIKARRKQIKARR